MDTMGFSGGGGFGGYGTASAANAALNFGPSIATGDAPASSASAVDTILQPPPPQMEEDEEDTVLLNKNIRACDLGSDVEGSNMDDREVLVCEDDDDMNRAVEELPPHACRYCTQHDPLSVAKCNVCNKWFCNSRFCTSGSHIITHLMRSKHKEIALHEDSPLGDAPLECYVCGARNVFLLGFIPSKEDSVVVLVCREPCLHSKTLMDMQWDPEGWQPLIQDRQLLPWLVTTPTGAALERCRHINNGQIKALEEMWRTKDGDLEDLIAQQRSEELREVPYHFKDGYDFRDLFQSLVDAECQTSREMKEQIAHENVSLVWETGLDGKRVAVLSLPLMDAKLSEGDALLLLHKESGWDGSGTILKIDQGAADEVKLELKGEAPPNATTGFTVKFVFKATTFDRMRMAMKTMATEETSLSAHLYHSLLGHQTDPKTFDVKMPKQINAPNLAPLNHSQQSAVQAVLRRPLSLIQGPPGTGKTTTSATLVYHLSKLHNAQVLVASPSNVAVDHLAERIAATGLNVVRIAALSREGISSSIDHLMLHVQVRQFCANSPTRSELNKLHRLKEELGELSARDKVRYINFIRRAEQDMIGAADVVCCTCSGAGDKRLSSIRFKHVLIDESTQATEPETLIPIVMGAKQVVLVGDHCQMGPVIMNTRAATAGLGRSMFERLVYLGHRPHRLEVQYRMHPCLSAFSSEHFYDGTLQNGVSEEDRDASKVFPWPNPRKPMFFYNSIGPEEVAANGTSYLNRTEAALTEKMLTHMMQNGVMPDQIGVVTPYEGQRAYLLNFLQRNGPLGAEIYERVEVASVDSFQGREKEFIVLTCVRSNDHQGIGFLKDWRRLNVALTRARKGVIILGNARVLARHKLWNALVSHFKEASLVVDGPINDLKPVNVALPKPREGNNPTGPAENGSVMYHSLGMTGATMTMTGATASQADSEATGSTIEPTFVDAPYIPGLAPAMQYSLGVGGVGMATGMIGGGAAGWQPASQASMSGISQSQ